MVPGSQGHEGSRILWARFEGKCHKFFVVVTYIPYAAKTGETQAKWLDKLDAILSTNAKPRDCVVMGDFNLKLPRNLSLIHI